MNDNMNFMQGGNAANLQTGNGSIDRLNPRKGNLPPLLNSAAFGNRSQHQLGEQTPGTGYDMNFTPLLPAQLLMGSPFQTGSPTTFSPQFNQFAFQQNNAQQQALANQMAAGGFQNLGGPMSPQLYQMMSPTFDGSFAGLQSPTMNGFGNPLGQQMINGTSRTVYLGNIPPDTSAEEILGHVRSGQIESVRLLADKNCAFISFLDGSSATHFHSDAILKKLSIRGSDIKIGWGKPSQVPTSVALAVQQQNASRNVYLGNLPEDVTEQELKDDLGKFGPIDTVKIVREKSIGFVHFLSIGNAIKAVSQLPSEPKWQAPRRVFYGKDRCAYVSKTQQQNAAQYLGIAPGYAHVLNGVDRQMITDAVAQQSMAAAAVATSAGGMTNLGNRTVYLGNIHPETTIEEICNVVRGGLLHHVRYIPDKHICFVTFIDPTAAASFYALSNIQGLMIHNRRLKIGWGKHSGALPPAIAMAVSGGASRNVYIGNLDETWTEERLRQDFTEYGEIELVNTLREKSCAFVNFTNIANAIKAIEGMRGREEYRKFKINFGKDRCGNPPRQNTLQQQQQQQQQAQGMVDGQEPISHSPPAMDSLSPPPLAISPAPGSTGSHNGSQGGYNSQGVPTPSGSMNAVGGNPLMMYLNQVSAAQQAQIDENTQKLDAFSLASLQQQQQQQLQQQTTLAGSVNTQYASAPNDLLHGSTMDMPQSAGISGAVGGSRAPRTSISQHSRTVSLPAFAQEPIGQSGHVRQSSQLPSHSHRQQQSSFGGLGSGFGGFGSAGFGLAIGTTDNSGRGLNGWVEEGPQ